MNILLAPLSFTWSSVNYFRRRWFGYHNELPVPVVSVGNILAGGVGKTEWVSLLASYFLSKNKKVVVAIRGYGSDLQHQSSYSCSYEEAVQKSFPDEALVLLKKNPGICIVVGKNRHEALLQFWEFVKPDVVLLDDGYQHFSLKRKLDILVHDFSIKTPLFRDFFSWLKNQSILISMSAVPAKLNAFTWVTARYEFKGLVDKNNVRTEIPKKVFLFSGIGNPERLEKALQAYGVEIIHFEKFRDHHAYTEADIALLHKKNPLHYPIITTLKDFVKLEKFKSTVQNIKWIDLEIKFSKNREYFYSIIEKFLENQK